MLLRHSNAARCMALSTDVVGGCGDGAASGGKDIVVGCTRARSGSTSAGRDGVGAFVSIPTWSTAMSTSGISSSSSSSAISAITQGTVNKVSAGDGMHTLIAILGLVVLP
jgi:hypothetical protein